MRLVWCNKSLDLELWRESMTRISLEDEHSAYGLIGLPTQACESA